MKSFMSKKIARKGHANLGMNSGPKGKKVSLNTGPARLTKGAQTNFSTARRTRP